MSAAKMGRLSTGGGVKAMVGWDGGSSVQSYIRHKVVFLLRGHALFDRFRHRTKCGMGYELTIGDRRKDRVEVERTRFHSKEFESSEHFHILDCGRRRSQEPSRLTTSAKASIAMTPGNQGVSGSGVWSKRKGCCRGSSVVRP